MNFVRLLSAKVRDLTSARQRQFVGIVDVARGVTTALEPVRFHTEEVA